MNKRQYLLFFTCIFVSFLPSSSAFASDLVSERGTLRGLEGVHVTVELIGDAKEEAISFGLIEAAIQTAVELKLRMVE